MTISRTDKPHTLACAVLLACLCASPDMHAAGLADAQACEATSQREAARITAQRPDGSSDPLALPEVYGDHEFFRSVGPGWVFALVRNENGWSLRVFDKPRADGGIDLSAVTPPFGGVPNPRDIAGWHFRNADNSGPNRGDVNAPQHLRVFYFSTSTGGGNASGPSQDAAAPRYSAPDPDDGVGWLRIVDFGLAGLEPGQRARMNYLQFDACLSWPASAGATPGDSNTAYLPEHLETFGSCGLDLAAFELSAAITPATLSVDLDGDDAIDELVQVRRIADGRRGLAVCRAGTWLTLLGLGNEADGDALRPGYIDQLEAWRMADQNRGPFGYVDEPPWPQSDGDIIVLERLEKEIILVFWRNGALHSQQVYRYVEP